jgi:hypothetical protein
VNPPRRTEEEDDYGTNPLEWFANYQDATPGSPLYENALTIYPPDRFEWDAKHDKLPTVSWILPTSGQSEHPAYLPASGANFLASSASSGRPSRRSRSASATARPGSRSSSELPRIYLYRRAGVSNELTDRHGPQVECHQTAVKLSDEHRDLLRASAFELDHLARA